MYSLHEDLTAGLKYADSKEIPKYIIDNIRHGFFPWQEKAFKKFLLDRSKKKPDTPTHRMFNMATGSGKTLLMAAAILYYYKQGYRHFLFFVNQNNIVDKTQNNFIDSTHSKYLFTDKIVINDKTVHITEVDAFSDTPQSIEIKCTTVQKLYNDIHTQKENKTTLADLHRKDIVMLADEAHHLNTDTKDKDSRQKDMHLTELTGRSSTEDIERKGWEHTVIDLILKKNGSPAKNNTVLLEFTATIPDNKAVADKYKKITVHTFELKDFLQRGYTKDIVLISSTLSKKERVLQALLFQWYRHHIALKYGIANFKAVVLFRSKTIQESKHDYDQFLDWINNISHRDFAFCATLIDKMHTTATPTSCDMGKSKVAQILQYISHNQKSFAEIADWIKECYQERSVLITNSKTNKNKTEKPDEHTDALLNSLEAHNNHIRAIFTVNRLTEGWDVLNLFDIVRLYAGRDEGKDAIGNRKTGKATISEKQLIGRGVRYFPFAYNHDPIKNKRKFDNDLTHELRILEELYFYSVSDHRYISELKKALKEAGYINDNRITRTFKLKPKFEHGAFYQNSKIWHNKKIKNPDRRKKMLDDIDSDAIRPYAVAGMKYTEEPVDLSVAEGQEAPPRAQTMSQDGRHITPHLTEIERHIVQKAINIKAKQENSLLQFAQLRQELTIESMEDLPSRIPTDCTLRIVVPKGDGYDDIDHRDKLGAVLQFLDDLCTQLKQHIVPNIGGAFIATEFNKLFSTPKTKIITSDPESEEMAKELKQKNWYVLDSFHGTAEERALICFIREHIGNLAETYSETYLLRNEEVYKIYDFKEGRGFQPDFLLFLKTKNTHNTATLKSVLHYQVFIEAKGEHIAAHDAWKKQFLEDIDTKYGLHAHAKILTAENQHYRLIGLPFYNTDNVTPFKDEFRTLLNT